MSTINTRASRLKPSETFAIKAKAEELKASGKKVIDLSTGEPDIDTPEHIKDAAIKALKDGKTKYTAVNGILPLREAIAQKLRDENGLSMAPENVIVTNGGKQALEELFEVTLEPGDEAVIPAPYWVSYPPMVELAGGKAVIVRTRPENNYRMSPEELKQAMTEKTRWVVINSPSNPCGAGYTADEMKALGKVIEAHPRAMVVSDEVYERICFGQFKFASFAAAVPELAHRTVTANSFSKTYSMTGWRVGYAAGPKEIISAIGRYQGQTTSNVCSIAQHAAIAALKGTHDYLPGLVETYERRIGIGIDLLSKTKNLWLPVKPEGAFYLFIRFNPAVREKLKVQGPVSPAVCAHLLEKALVAAVPGDAFGDDGAFRVSVAAADASVREGISSLVRVFDELMA